MSVKFAPPKLVGERRSLIAIRRKPTKDSISPNTELAKGLGDKDTTQDLFGRNEYATQRRAPMEQQQNSDLWTLSTEDQNICLEILDSSNLCECDTTMLSHQLSEQLVMLEKADLHEISTSEDSVMAVVGNLSDASVCMEGVQFWLSEYKSRLEMMSQQLKYVEVQNTTLDIQTRNHQRLEKVLGVFLQSVSLPEEKTSILSMPCFDTRVGVSDAVDAAMALIAAIERVENPTLSRMLVLKDKATEMDSLKTIFCDHTRTFLLTQFEKAAQFVGSSEDEGMRNSMSSLLRYSELISCINDLSPDSMRSLRLGFVKLFKPRFAGLFKGISSAYRTEHLELDQADVRLASLDSHPVPSEAVSTTAPRQATLRPTPTTKLLSDSLSNSLSSFASSIQSFFSTVIEPRCLENERVVRDLLCLSDDDGDAMVLDIMDSLVGQPLMAEVSVVVANAAKNNPFGLVAIVSATLEDDGGGGGGGENDSDPEADGPTMEGNKSRAKRVGRPVPKSTCLIMEKLKSQWRELASTSFAAFVDKQSTSICEMKFDARRCGVIAPVLKFPSFVTATLICANGKDSRLVHTELNKMCQSLFTTIKTTAQSNQKYTDVVMMENMFTLWWHLSSARLAGEDMCADTARNAYDLFSTHSRKYSEWIVLCQFEAVLDFFKELESFVNVMDLTDIMFQERFSKNAFRDLVETHLSATAVRKSVTQMRKRVEKHISVESGLKALAWKMVSDRLLEVYESWEGLVTTVYRPATLEMRVDDVEVVCGLVQ